MRRGSRSAHAPIVSSTECTERVARVLLEIVAPQRERNEHHDERGHDRGKASVAAAWPTATIGPSTYAITTVSTVNASGTRRPRCKPVPGTSLSNAANPDGGARAQIGQAPKRRLRQDGHPCFVEPVRVPEHGL